MAEQAMSPTPKKIEVVSHDEPIEAEIVQLEKEVDFPTAIQAVTIGKKIHKLEWKDREYYGFLNNEILSLHKPDGKNYQWVLSEGDLKGEDYIVI